MQAEGNPISTNEAMSTGKASYFVSHGVNTVCLLNLVQVAMFNLIEAVEASRGNHTRTSVSEAQSRWVAGQLRGVEVETCWTTQIVKERGVQRAEGG